MHLKNNLATIPGYAIVEILQDQKERMFYKDVTLKNGSTMKLTLDIPISGLYDGHHAQGVSLAKVVSLGDGIDNMDIGDEVVIDYTIDTDSARVISNEGGRKLVRVIAKNKFYDEDGPIISATTETRYETRDHKKGDVELSATIFGIVKGNEIIPNYPYIFLKYINMSGEYEETESGLLVPSSEGEMVIRQVLFAHPASPMKPGDTVVVDFMSLYERYVNGEMLSVCLQDDIIGRFEN